MLKKIVISFSTAVLILILFILMIIFNLVLAWLFHQIKYLSNSNINILISSILCIIIFILLMILLRRKTGLFLKIICIILMIINTAISAFLSNESNKILNSAYILDQAVIIDNFNYKRQKYYINLVTSGWNDKADFLEISRGKIIYDKNGNKSNDNIIFSCIENTDIDSASDFKSVKFDPVTKKLLIYYSNNNIKTIDLSGLL